jgi:hypothetical protein
MGFFITILILIVVVLGSVAAMAAAGIRSVGLGGARNHPIAWGVISFGLVMLFGAAILSLMWPRPDIPGGWCGSGAAAVHDQYTVTMVAQDALVVTLILAPCVVVAAALLPRSLRLRVAVALGTSFVVAIPVLLAWITLGFKIDCAGS